MWVKFEDKWVDLDIDSEAITYWEMLFGRELSSHFDYYWIIEYMIEKTQKKNIALTSDGKLHNWKENIYKTIAFTELILKSHWKFKCQNIVKIFKLFSKNG